MTDKNSPDFVPREKRIAAFDNDGTLWAEQPMYFQFFYVTDRVKAMAPHSGMTTDEFEKSVKDWIATAKHPKTGKLFAEMAYQPMLKLLAYLRGHGFKAFIVSGGGIEFMRPWAEKLYGIPPEQIVESSGGLQYEMRDGRPVIVKLPNLVLNDDKEGKPVGIQRHIDKLDKGLDEAKARGWTVVDLKNDWNEVFASP